MAMGWAVNALETCLNCLPVVVVDRACPRTLLIPALLSGMTPGVMQTTVFYPVISSRRN